MHEQEAGSVAAVIVTFNRKALLQNCLDAVLAQTCRPDIVYVIDNASSDGTAALIAERYQQKVSYQRLQVNTGGAGGFSHGVWVAYAAGYKWIWVMDDDVEPDSACLGKLLKTARAGPNRIAVPLRLSNDGNLAEYASVRYDLDAPLCLPGHHQRSVLEKYRATAAVPDSLRLQNFSFEGPLIPCNVVTAAGLPTREYFIYGDDTDYALRARRAGFEIVLVREARLKRLADPSQALAPWKCRYMIRNPMWINRLHGHNRAVRRLRNYLWAACLAVSSLLRLARPSRWCELRPRMRGIREGLWALPPGSRR